MNTRKKVNNLFFIVLLVNFGVSMLLSVLFLRCDINIYVELILSQCTILIPAFIFLLVNKCELSDWVPIKKIKFTTVLYIVLFMVLFSPLITLFNLISQLFTTNEVAQLSVELMDMPMIASVLFIGFVGPFCEEFVFRGVIFHGLKKSGRVLGAAIITGVFFGLLHLNINQMFYAIPMGIAFSLLVEATGSILGSFTAHATINTWNSILAIGTVKILKFLGMEDMFSQSAQETVTNDILFKAIGAYAVVAVFSTALAVVVYIAICRNEGNYDKVKNIFVKNKATGGAEAESDEVPCEENLEKKTPLLTFTGYVAIALCIFVIFFLDKLMEYIFPMIYNG